MVSKLFPKSLPQQDLRRAHWSQGLSAVKIQVTQILADVLEDTTGPVEFSVPTFHMRILRPREIK